MKKYIITTFVVLLSLTSYAQVGIGSTPNTEAALHIDGDKKSLLLPRMTTAERPASPAPGLMIFNTTINCLEFWNGTEWDNMCRPKIGDFILGGIVFYIAPTPTDLNGDGEDNIGLVIALNDQSTGAEWGCRGTDITGNGRAIGTGAQNTANIVAQCSTTGIAARLSDNLTLNGYSDWFLPSRDELAEMAIWTNTLNVALQENGGQALSAEYWSSTQNTSTSAWIVNSDTALGASRRVKDDLYNVRSVRAF